MPLCDVIDMPPGFGSSVDEFLGEFKDSNGQRIQLGHWYVAEEGNILGFACLEKFPGELPIIACPRYAELIFEEEFLSYTHIGSREETSDLANLMLNQGRFEEYDFMMYLVGEVSPSPRNQNYFNRCMAMFNNPNPNNPSQD